ncbi:MAG: hypothetical protein HY747_08440 [Elusimicrobia bacterium]|nr:hypothetical protein [Elusimicrobiota bacterium]
MKTKILTVLAIVGLAAPLFADQAQVPINSDEAAQARMDRIDRRIDARLDRQERQAQEEQASASVNNPDEESVLAQEAMATFDGAQGESASQSQPISVEDGVALMSRTDEVTDSYVRPAHRTCHHGMKGSARSCRRIPAATVEEHRVTSNYQIVNRAEYVRSERERGVLIGGLIGGGAGLAAVVILGACVFLSPALIVIFLSAGAIGLAVGSGIAKKNARNKPQEFTETENYTESV